MAAATTTTTNDIVANVGNDTLFAGGGVEQETALDLITSLLVGT